MPRYGFATPKVDMREIFAGVSTKKWRIIVAKNIKAVLAGITFCLSVF